jgi:hypothetical protein
MNLQPGPTTPAVAPSSNPKMHGFIQSVLSGTLRALAGRPETKYITDANGRVVADPNQPQDTNADRGRRLAAHAFEGLAAGASVPQQKSGAASALAGLGAGASSQLASATAADRAAQGKAREDYEAQQRQILNKANVAHLNANTFSLWQDAIQRNLDHDPERAIYQAIYNAASDPESNLETRIVTDQEAHAMRESDNHSLAKHVFLPRGMKPVFENGELVRNADGSPKETGQIAVISANDNGKFNVPQKLVDDVKKYSKAAGIVGEDGLKAGDEMEFNHFARLYGEIQAAKKTAAGAKHELVTVADETASEGQGFGVEKGRKLQRRNPISGDLSDPDATELQNYRKGQADISNKQDKGEVTPHDRFIQDREDQRAKLKQKQDAVTSDLIGEDFLRMLPTGRQGTVRAVGEGRQLLPANRKEALALLEDVHQAFPDFDETKVKTWQKANNEYRGSGKTATQIVPAYNTALEHMQDLYSNTTGEGIFNPLSKSYQDREVALGYVAREVGKAVSAGAMTQKESEDLLATLKGGLTPALKRERITKTAQLLHDKIDEYQTKFNDSAPSSAVKVPTLISPRAAQSYDFVQGGGKTQPAQNPQSGQTQNQTPAPTTHSVSISTAMKNHPGMTEDQVRAWAKKNNYEVAQ